MVRRRAVRMVNYLMLVLYLGYFTGTTIFIHSHFFQNHIVVHSHPYTNSQHGHSESELLVLDQLQDRTSTEAVYFSMPTNVQCLCCTLVAIAPSKLVFACDVAASLLRAPPVM
ncbi:MAG: hypothetical protein J6X16_03535 [Bacteroidales bacterium]|nr:hypothetical protein [Bacteroidales bacterium]